MSPPPAKEPEPQWPAGPYRIGYNDGSGPEYITRPDSDPEGVGSKPIATLRWGCSCCKDIPESFDAMAPEERALAHLIVAAPDLYEACKAALADLISDLEAIGYEEQDISENDGVKKLRAALAKARGESP